MTTRHTIPRLLARRDRLSVVEKEQILDAVLREVAPARSRRRLGVPLLALGAALTLALVAVPLVRSGGGGSAGAGRFTARGRADSAPSFEPVCRSAAKGTCERGDKLAFAIDAAAHYHYFAAFAKRSDGTVIWYFPASAQGESIALSRHLEGGVLDRGVELGPAHRPGTYRVFGLFSTRPLTRADIRARFDADRMSAGAGTAVIVRKLVVR